MNLMAIIMEITTSLAQGGTIHRETTIEGMKIDLNQNPTDPRDTTKMIDKDMTTLDRKNIDNRHATILINIGTR